LLAQVDSSIGGKVAVNFGQHLNGLTIFYSPLMVLTDPNLLTTLPPEEYRSGLGELVKYAVVLDAELFEYLEQNLALVCDANQVDPTIIRCVERKCEVVSEDPLEKGLLRLYDYGHEIGHAIEVAYDYHHLRHGEAVSIGMQAAAWLGVQSGLTDASVLRRQSSLLSKLDLPTNIPPHLRKDHDPKTLAEKIGVLLKKSRTRYLQNVLWAVPTKLGEAVCDVTFEWPLVCECLKRLSEGSLE
jgi:3-dehydroquinate synthase